MSAKCSPVAESPLCRTFFRCARCGERALLRVVPATLAACGIFSNVTFSFRPFCRCNMPRIPSCCRVLTEECRRGMPGRWQVRREAGVLREEKNIGAAVSLSSLRPMHHFSGGIFRTFSSRLSPAQGTALPSGSHQQACLPPTNKSFRKEDGGAGEGGKPFFMKIVN